MIKSSACLPALVAILSFSMFAGCTNSAPKPAAASAPSTTKSDPQRFGADMVRQTVDPAECWKGLQLINGSFNQRREVRDRQIPGDEYRKMLVDVVCLTDTEVQEVAAPAFVVPDAFYVAECFLLRDTARALETAKTPPAVLAEAALRWVHRHVLLHQQHDEWLPPGAVVRRGYGSSSDRVRVLAALLQQLQMRACLFVLPKAPDDVVLVGVVATEPSDVYLLDPRHAVRLRTSGGTVPTLKDALADPKLLERVGLTEAQLKSMEVRLAIPLGALSYRMRELEHILAAHDRITLHIEPAATQRLFQDATGRPVRVWNGPSATDNSPTRALRFFLPADQGGTDKTGRQQRFVNDLFPATAIRMGLEQIHLGRGDLPDAALGPLLKILNELFEKYDQQPREMLVRGKREAVKHRMDRLRSFLEAENLNLHGAPNDPEVRRFQQTVADWRNRITEAIAAAAAGNRDKLNAIWSEDHYVISLLQVDDEEPPERFRKMALTSIVAYLARDHLARRALWVTALAWHDEAARADRRAESAPKGNAATDAKSAWKSARAAWDVYLDRAAMGPDVREARLQPIRVLLKANGEHTAADAAHLLEQLHLDLRAYYAARFHYARAFQRVNGDEAARPVFTALDDELGHLLDKDKYGKIGLQADIDAVLAAQRANAPVTRSLQLLQNDWTPQGNYYWLRQQVRRNAP
jgi:hypothetical protein